MNEYMECKARRLEEVRSRQQYDELQECTFAPATNAGKPAPAASGPVLIRGLSNHLEKQKAATKLQQEQRRREDEVFMTKPKDPVSKFTVPRPFAFSTSNPVRSPDH
jgi:hypothetical protein